MGYAKNLYRCNKRGWEDLQERGLLFTLQDDQTTVDANFVEVEIGDTERVGLV